MYLFDLMLTVDKEGRITSVEWRNEARRLSNEPLWALLKGNQFSQMFSKSMEQDSGTLQWSGETFFYERVQTPEQSYYFIKLQDHKEALLQAALDTFQDGVQIYDQDANVVYLNKASRVVSGFEDTMPLEGKHLMDLYPDLDEGYSTTLTTLRTRQPVHHRFANYESFDGKQLITLNTGYPVISDGQLLGSVLHEQNIVILQEKMQQLEKLKAAMYAQLSGDALRRHTTKRPYSFSDIIGHSKPLRHAVELAERVSLRDGNVLLVGETGTGKEIFAQSIHYASPRKEGKFVSLNCAAVPETLIESVLFGTTKGAFTGSMDKAGLFEEAADGTLFLDELNSMSLSMQSKLLRVLQEGTFRRIGSAKDIHTNVRIISACNEDPYLLVEQNKMRRDLFYRVGTILINIPPLRDRLDDVEELAYHYLRIIAPRYALTIQEIAPQTLDILRRYSWPGNVRELNHAIDYAMNLCSGEVLLPEHLPEHLLEHGQPTETSAPSAPQRPADAPAGRLQDMMDEYESQLIRAALRSCQGNISQTAIKLDIRRQSLQYRIRKYGIIF